MGGRGGGSGRGGGGAVGGGGSADSLQSTFDKIDKLKFPSMEMGYAGIRVSGVGTGEVIKANKGYMADVLDPNGYPVAGGGISFQSAADAKSYVKTAMKSQAVAVKLKSKIGTAVANNGSALGTAIGADAGTLRHIGNYNFIAKVKGIEVKIHTKPTTGTGNRIRITGVTAD